MLNLASNDYLGLASDLSLREQFFDETPNAHRVMSSSSSRLLTGNFPEYEQLEASLSQAFAGRAALLFNSGYHMNIGILPAVSDAKTLILADKLVHASMIDGIRLSSAKYVRYRHNDLQHLALAPMPPNLVSNWSYCVKSAFLWFSSKSFCNSFFRLEVS